jgi:hypothetical protein
MSVWFSLARRYPNITFPWIWIFGMSLGRLGWMIDQEKAFDRVEYKYLWHTFEAISFSSGFIAMIRVIYGDIERVWKVNGGFSAPFKVCRGTRQGCSLSRMLYAIAIEPLLNSIRRRIVVNLSEDIPPVPLSAYADDGVILVKNQV